MRKAVGLNFCTSGWLFVDCQLSSVKIFFFRGAVIAGIAGGGTQKKDILMARKNSTHDGCSLDKAQKDELRHSGKK